MLLPNLFTMRMVGRLFQTLGLRQVLIAFCNALAAHACSKLVRRRSIVEGLRWRRDKQLRPFPAVIILLVTVVFQR